LDMVAKLNILYDELLYTQRAEMNLNALVCFFF
jgi:hypothetical protein